MIRVKICGINDRPSFDAAIDAGADWLGFVFFPPSPRFVSPATAAGIVEHRKDGPLRVGLFVEPTVADIAPVLERFRLDILQIYGGSLDLGAIKATFGLPVWRSLGVDSRCDLPAGPAGADGFVVEAKPPAGADRPGGNAVSFDWTVLRGWSPPVPWLLAGGLTPRNVAMAIQRSGARAVDVSSGVERARGAKDPSLIAAFVKAARGGA